MVLYLHMSRQDLVLRSTLNSIIHSYFLYIRSRIMYPEPWNYGSIQQNHDNIIYTRMRASIESAFLAKYNTAWVP